MWVFEMGNINEDIFCGRKSSVCMVLDPKVWYEACFIICEQKNCQASKLFYGQNRGGTVQKGRSQEKSIFDPLPLVQTFVGFCPYKNGVCLDLHPPLKFWTELSTLSTSASFSLVHCIIKKINFSMIQIGQSLHIIRSKTNMQIHLFLNKIFTKKFIQKHA